MALCANLISVSSLSRKKKCSSLYFILFPCGGEGEQLCCGWSVGAGRGVPYVVLPDIASTQAFFPFMSGHTHATVALLLLRPHCALLWAAPAPTALCHPQTRRSSCIGDSLDPSAGVGVYPLASVPGLGIVNCSQLSCL